MGVAFPYLYFIGWRSVHRPIRKPFSPKVFEFSTPEDGTDRLSQNIGNKLPLLAV